MFSATNFMHILYKAAYGSTVSTLLEIIIIIHLKPVSQIIKKYSVNSHWNAAWSMSTYQNNKSQL